MFYEIAMPSSLWAFSTNERKGLVFFPIVFLIVSLPFFFLSFLSAFSSSFLLLPLPLSSFFLYSHLLSSITSFSSSFLSSHPPLLSSFFLIFYPSFFIPSLSLISPHEDSEVAIPAQDLSVAGYLSEVPL